MSKVSYVFLAFLFLFSPVFAGKYSGTIEVFIEDHFEKKTAKKIHELRQNNGERVKLTFKNEKESEGLTTGDEITVVGEEEALNSNVPNIFLDLQEKEKQIHVNSYNVTKKANVNGMQEPMLASPKRIGVFIVDFLDKKASDTISVDNVDHMMYKSPTSMQKNFEINSLGAVSFNPDANENGRADINQISVNYNIGTTCEPLKWLEDVKNAATAKGMNISIYTHIMLVVPKEVNCGWAGLGALGCGATCSSWVIGLSPSPYATQLFTHELGHNFGLNHASADINNDGVQDSEYGDDSCIMGISQNTEFNAPHRDLAGWFIDPAISFRVINVAPTIAKSYPLSPLEEGRYAKYYLAVKIKKSESETWYISHRKNIGDFGAGISSYGDKVTIHYIKSGNTRSYFVKSISVGETFADPKSNIKITFTRMGWNWADVTIGPYTTALQ